jgi:hypothetical protein
MIVALVIAYFVFFFLLAIGLILILKPSLATGPRGIPLLKDQPAAMMSVLAAREIVLGCLAGGMAYTGNLRGLLLAFLIAPLISVIDAVALYQTRSTFGFIVNAVVGLMMLTADGVLWRALGGL